MDDFKVENMTGTHESLLFYGDNPDEYIKDLTHIEPARIRDDEFLIYDSEGKHSIVHRNEDGFGGFIIIYASEDTEHFYNKLFEKRFTEIFGLRESNSNEYETKRIEYGIPKFGKEMNEHTNPLECGLEKYVSFTKGCYIGQEVISRLDTYDKVSKHLTGIKINEKLPSSGLADIKITLDGKECGYSTSYADSEKYGSIGLGFVKTQFLDHNKDYKLKFNETLIECKITKLPFEN
jgi:folate-binding protein YgfZ